MNNETKITMGYIKKKELIVTDRRNRPGTDVHDKKNKKL